MERVNKDYVRVDKIDLLCNVEGDKSGIVQNLLNCIFNYERDNNTYVGDFYMDVNGIYYSRLASVYEFPVNREGIINSFAYAGYENNLQMLFALRSYLEFDNVSVKKLGKLSDYVLEHSMSLNEYFEGEPDKLVFDEANHTFVMKKIYSKTNDKSRILK